MSLLSISAARFVTLIQSGNQIWLNVFHSVHWGEIHVGNKIYWGRPINISNLHLTPQTRGSSDNLSFNHVSPFTALTLSVSAGPRKRSFKELSREAVCVCVYVCLCHCVYSWCVCKPQRLQSQTKASLFIFVHYHKWWVQAQHLETVVFVRQYLTWNKCSFVTFEEFQRNWELSLIWWDEVFITLFIQVILNQSNWWLTLGEAWYWLKKHSNLLEEFVPDLSQVN